MAPDGKCGWVEHVGFADPSWGQLGGSGGGGTLLKGVDHSCTATGKLLLEPDAERLDAEDSSAAASKSFSEAGFKSKTFCNF